MAELVRCLLCKHENLSLNPSAHKKLGVAVYIHHPRTVGSRQRQADHWSSLANWPPASQPSQADELQVQ